MNGRDAERIVIEKIRRGEIEVDGPVEVNGRVVYPPGSRGREAAGVAEARVRTAARRAGAPDPEPPPGPEEVERRRRRFTKALLAVTRTSGIPLSVHESEVWRAVTLRLTSDGWTALQNAARRQEWWYRVAIHTLAVIWVEQHVESCPSCMEGRWKWLLNYPPSVPEGRTFDLEGIEP